MHSVQMFIALPNTSYMPPLSMPKIIKSTAATSTAILIASNVNGEESMAEILPSALTSALFAPPFASISLICGNILLADIPSNTAAPMQAAKATAMQGRAVLTSESTASLGSSG